MGEERGGKKEGEGGEEEEEEEGARREGRGRGVLPGNRLRRSFSAAVAGRLGEVWLERNTPWVFSRP